MATEGCAEDLDVILMIDVDFSLCCGKPSLMESVIERYAERVRTDPDGSLAFVLPAFGHTSRGGARSMVRSRTELVKALKAEQMETFQQGPSPESHACDKVKKWRRLANHSSDFETPYR